MLTSYSSEVTLKNLAIQLLQSDSPDFGLTILGDEASIFQIASNLTDKESSQLKIRLSFCVLILLISDWKTKLCNWDLPQFLYNYFKVVSGFIYFSSTNDGKDQIFEKYGPGLEELSKDKDNLLLFVPEKFLKEKRLYRIRRSDLARISTSDTWSKLPDPHNCKSWIKLPQHYERLKTSQVLTRKFSRELLAGVDYTEEVVAKKMIIRNLQAPKRSTMNAAANPGSSIFKKKAESVKEKEVKNDSVLTPIALSEFDFDNSPTFNKIEPTKAGKRTHTSQSTKITNQQESPDDKKAASAQAQLTKESKFDTSPSTVVGSENMSTDRPKGKLIHYTLNIGHKRLFPGS